MKAVTELSSEYAHYAYDRLRRGFRQECKRRKAGALSADNKGVKLRLFFCLCTCLLIAPARGIAAQEIFRGEVRIDLEPVYGFYVDEIPEGTVRAAATEAPLDLKEAGRRAKVEAAMLFGAMIYGWSFHYDIGEKARGIEEDLELTPLGLIVPEDPRLEVTDTRIQDYRLYQWSDYRASEAQKKRASMWKTGTTRTAQALGHGPLGRAPAAGGGEDAWLTVKQAALEDAARRALRTMLRGTERNRPKEVSGYISLAAFPQFWLDRGQWAAAGRFLVRITDITPFAVH